MKRDMDLVYKILQFFENKEDFTSRVTPDITGYSDNEIHYHIKLMGQAGLLEAKDLSTFQGTQWAASSLTHYGHEFFDAIRQESVWETIKQEFKDAGLETVVSVSKRLADTWAKKKVDGLLNEDS